MKKRNHCVLSYNGYYGSLIRNSRWFDSIQHDVYTYQTTPSPRIKRFTKTITRTFDENENMIEEREEENTEYEYVGEYPYTTSPGWNTPWIYTTSSTNTLGQ